MKKTLLLTLFAASSMAASAQMTEDELKYQSMEDVNKVVDLTLAAPGAACEEAGNHDENQKHCDNFFHFRSSK